MLVLDLLNLREQPLTANNSLVSKLALVLYRGLKALARYIVSQKLNITNVAEGIHGTQVAQKMDYWRFVWTKTIKTKSQKRLCLLGELYCNWILKHNTVA